MMSKATVYTFCIILGAAVAEPVRLASIIDSLSNNPNTEMAAKTDAVSLIETISSLIGFKISAISIAVTVIQWVISNIFVIIIGATTVLGLCKLTGKCSLNYEEYIPITQIQSYATSENLEAAQDFLVQAVNTYAERRKRQA